MNREQRRAALKQKQLNKIKGFDMTTGTLEIDIKGSDEKLEVDVMDFGVVSAIMEMVHKFSNPAESYKEDYEKAFKSNDSDGYAVFSFAKKIVMEFSDAVESIFGEGSCKKIFGHKYPQLIQIQEFIEDFTPISQAIIAASGMSEIIGDNTDDNKVVSMPTS